MLENLDCSRGVVFSGQVLLELARRGVSREQAYEWVQRNAMRSFDEQQDFKPLLLADADMTAVLPAAEVEKAFDLEVSSSGTSTPCSNVFSLERGGLDERGIRFDGRCQCGPVSI